MNAKKNGISAILGPVLLAAMTVNLYLIFMFAPEEGSMGQVQRIFYFHVPSAWVAGLAFFVVFVASIGYLWKKDRKYDMLANASAEIGTVFATLVLVTGPIWARPVWNTWWEWSPRLTLFLLLWFIFVAYMMLRNFVDNPEKSARYAAVFGIIGFLDVPIVYMSIRLWRDIHPSPVIAGGEGSGLNPDMRITFFFSLFTFTLLYFYLLKPRLQLEKSQTALDDTKRRLAFRDTPKRVSEDKSGLKEKVALVLVVLSLLAGDGVQAQVSRLVHYQGSLTQEDGTAFSGTTDLQFSIYTRPQADKPVWTETHTNVDVKDGQFEVLLGSRTPLDLSFYEYYLEVQAPALDKALPRISITGSGYNFRLWFLFAAYTIVWVALFAYVLSISRRQKKIISELEMLAEVKGS